MNATKSFFFLPLISFATVYPGCGLYAVDAEVVQRRIDALNAVTTEGSINPVSDSGTPREEPNPIVRRAVVRSLAKKGPFALEQLKSYALTDDDLLVRRTALRAITAVSQGEETVGLLKKVLEQDKDELVRLAAVEELANITPRTKETLLLLRSAQSDPSYRVIQMATNALWTYDADVVSARERSEYRDTQLSAMRIDLPKIGWRFKTDPNQTGHIQDWASAGFDDSSWATVGIERPWRDFGFKHEGVAWYRLTFKLPEAPTQIATDLVFDAVDEAAWVWVNGEFLGAHDIGPEGYNRPFAADTRDVLKWGEENTVVVRVSKPSGGHAGIWKPVYLEVLN